ncbi:metal ABC transporter permease [Pelagibaculum spongiae]|uniref:Zinc/manganese transporter permease n=1 Tax=Pelagibaculum spongiae TaxID=2080658 RepID=A0A2V1H6H6_9GAMM|nr:metal ABC transporter permease [Pelagibaculum spongiae]PVZ72032.1 zinc/manganese transporter permease [Pelagibaculum spongiae]
MDALLLHLEILTPAMIAGLLVLSTHVYFGREVLDRGILFLDLAIAQIAALGLIVASNLFLVDENSWLQQLIALSAAVAGSMLLYRFRNLPTRIQEALIGCSFMLAATGSILLLAKDPHGGERLKALLDGQILWVESQQLIFTAVIYAGVLILWKLFQQRAGHWFFYPLFAITITLSTQLIGVYLVFASLIVPALASYRFGKKISIAWLVGIAGYSGGLVLSAVYDLPSGAMIVWSLAGAALLVNLMKLKTQN